MPALRELLTDAGFTNVSTYVQSGNIVLEADAPAAKVARECERLITEAFGFKVPVVVRTRDELSEIVGRNPLGDVADNPKLYQVSFLDSDPEPEVVRHLAERATGGERLVAIGRELYAWHPGGIGRSALAAELARNGTLNATARNWNTVLKLLAMADG